MAKSLVFDTTINLRATKSDRKDVAAMAKKMGVSKAECARILMRYGAHMLRNREKKFVKNIRAEFSNEGTSP